MLPSRRTASVLVAREGSGSTAARSFSGAWAASAGTTLVRPSAVCSTAAPSIVPPMLAAARPEAKPAAARVADRAECGGVHPKSVIRDQSGARRAEQRGERRLAGPRWPHHCERGPLYLDSARMHDEETLRSQRVGQHAPLQEDREKSRIRSGSKVHDDPAAFRIERDIADARVTNVPPTAARILGRPRSEGAVVVLSEHPA